MGAMHRLGTRSLSYLFSSNATNRARAVACYMTSIDINNNTVRGRHLDPTQLFTHFHIMSTPERGKRYQPERKAKTRAAMRQMDGTQRPRNGVLGAVPSSYYLAIPRYCDYLRRYETEYGNMSSPSAVFIGTEFSKNSHDKDLGIGILRVCRQMYAETCLLAYAVNVFWFYDRVPFMAWLKRRLPEQKAAVRRIWIFCYDCEVSSLRSFSRLNHAKVFCLCKGICPLSTERGRVVKKGLEGIWGRGGSEIKIVRGMRVWQ
ncbi:hypothetical protein GMOD_00002050 [Pyrenophora seminiperda CCB06]|uniref:Uncharacterized protein n=1 Tax=Pyrenophora seminiperda CCB06 TaxID=1302712 RepID=A0A3M7LWX4_9PLEO|nr:hypothetical protein GMOD_00002050 [Pyrenophora seminiperda CCB06]